MFVVRTKDGLLIGPFSSYESAEKFGAESMFEVDDVYRVLEPRPDHMGVSK